MYNDIFKAILNTIFNSIFETSGWVVLILILIKQRNLIDIYFIKNSIKNILIPALPTAISINVMRYILHLDNLTNFLIVETMMIFLIIYLVKKNNFLNKKIEYLKIIFWVIVSDLVLIFLTEGSYAIIVSLILKESITEINNNIWLNILLALTPRLIQYLLIILYFHKKNFEQKINYIEVIFKNKVLSISTIVFFGTALSVYFISARFIAESQILQKYELTIQIISSVLVLLIPCTLIASYIISLCDLINKNIKLQREKEYIYDDNDDNY